MGKLRNCRINFKLSHKQVSGRSSDKEAKNCSISRLQEIFLIRKLKKLLQKLGMAA